MPQSSDLEQAEAENVVPHPPQPRRIELEPDQEEQQDDAELGDVAASLSAPSTSPSTCGPTSAPATR